jgi:hypothetical protein
MDERTLICEIIAEVKNNEQIWEESVKIRSLVKGKLLEINENIIKDPNLLIKKVILI